MRQENMIPNKEDQPNLFKLAERISRRPHADQIMEYLIKSIKEANYAPDKRKKHRDSGNCQRCKP